MSGQPPIEGDEVPENAPDARLFAPATQRNRAPILEVLSRVLPTEGCVLEIASGTGEHGAWFARQLRPLVWQPSDPDPAMRRSIAAHGRGTATLRPPLDLDAARHPWPIERVQAVVCINMLHIAPWAAAEGLMTGAARVLAESGPLYLYGPYRRDGRHTAPSNEAFDRSLRTQNPDWGVRDLEAVTELALGHGLRLAETFDMPADNLSLVYTRS